MRHFFLLLASCAAAFSQCSLDSVQGTWAYQSQGTMMTLAPGSSTPVAVPFVGFGVQKIDYQAKFTLNGRLNAGGQIQSIQVTGSIQVDPSCTATDSYTLPGVPGVRSDRLLIFDNGNEMRLMGTNAGGVAAATYRRVAWGEPQCTTDMVHGVYGGYFDGAYRMIPPGQTDATVVPSSGIVGATIQWDGTGSGVATMSFGGAVVDVTFPQLTLQVKPDCTATMSWKAVSRSGNENGQEQFIILNNGNELWGMQTQNSSATPITVNRFKRLSMTPVAPKW